jgi:hypothetical protein
MHVYRSRTSYTFMIHVHVHVDVHEHAQSDRNTDDKVSLFMQIETIKTPISMTFSNIMMKSLICYH